MKTRIVKIICAVFGFSCSNSESYEETSISFLKGVYKEFDQGTCTFVIHPYGAFYTWPLLSTEDLEELSSYLGEDVNSRIKAQRELMNVFCDYLKLEESHITYAELEELKTKDSEGNIKYWPNIEEKYECISAISLPIFSDDYKYAFTYEYTHFHGKAGGGKCCIYELIEDRYELIKTFNEFIS